MRDDPFLDAGMRGWILRFASRQHHRVARWIDLDDLIQDGFFCYAKCRERYTRRTESGQYQVWLRRTKDWGPAVDEPTKEDRRHLMSLVQTAFKNHISTLSTRKRALSETLACDLTGDDEDDSQEAAWNRVAPPEAEEATLATLIQQAPNELKMLFQLLWDDGCRDIAYLRTRIRQSYVQGRQRLSLGKLAKRETTNQHFCRLLGLDPEKVDLMAMAAEHFGVDLE